MIILDFSGTMHAAVFIDLAQHGQTSVDYVRHLVLNTLRFHYVKNRDRYGDMVIALDSRKYWRKEAFPYYKQGRQQARAASTVNYKEVFEAMNTVRDEVIQHMPYRTVMVEGCEADDVIGTIVKRHEFGPLEDTLIISNDKDFRQLHSHGVKQFFPSKGKQEREVDPKRFLFEHIIRGDSGDGVPNIKSEPNTLIVPDKKQSPITKKFLAEAMAFGSMEAYRKSLTGTLAERWDENRLLIDLEMTPLVLQDRILEAVGQKPNGSRAKLLQFLLSRHLKSLADKVCDF